MDFLIFFAKDFQIAMQSVTQNFKLKFQLEAKLEQTKVNRRDFLHFFVQDFQITFRSATQNFKLKFEVAVYRLKMFKGIM